MLISGLYMYRKMQAMYVNSTPDPYSSRAKATLQDLLLRGAPRRSLASRLRWFGCALGVARESCKSKQTGVCCSRTQRLPPSDACLRQSLPTSSRITLAGRGSGVLRFGHGLPTVQCRVSVRAGQRLGIGAAVSPSPLLALPPSPPKQHQDTDDQTGNYQDGQDADDYSYLSCGGYIRTAVC